MAPGGTGRRDFVVVRGPHEFFALPAGDARVGPLLALDPPTPAMWPSLAVHGVPAWRRTAARTALVAAPFVTLAAYLARFAIVAATVSFDLQLRCTKVIIPAGEKEEKSTRFFFFFFFFFFSSFLE